jgi:glucose-6-phosphate 1-dehydrogenase
VIRGRGEREQSETLRGKTVEMIATHQPCPEEMDAYERGLGDAMDGDAGHFARQDYVEEAWRIVDPILKNPGPVFGYERNTWGPVRACERVTPPEGWHDPVAAKP